METVKAAFNRIIEIWKTNGFVGKAAIAVASLLVLCCMCTVPVALISPDEEEPTAESRTQEIALDEPESDQTQELAIEPTQEPQATYTDQPTYTPLPTHTLRPTQTPIPTSTKEPTATKTAVPTRTRKPTSTATTLPPTDPPPTDPPPTDPPPTDPPPTLAPPTAVPPTQVPPTAIPPTQPPPTSIPATQPPSPAEQPAPTETPAPPPVVAAIANLIITAVNKGDEFVDIQNVGDAAIDLGGWKLVSEKGNQECGLGGQIPPGVVLRIWALAEDAGQGGFNCNFGSNIWNNSEHDPAVLYDPTGAEVSRR